MRGDEHSVLEGDSKSSIHLDEDNMILDGEYSGNNDLGFPPNKWVSVIALRNVAKETLLDQQSTGGFLEEVATVEDVMKGDEDADASAEVGHAASSEEVPEVTNIHD